MGVSSMKKTYTLDQLSDEYSELLATMEILPRWEPAIDRAARIIVRNRARYEEIADQIGMPWGLIGAWHWRESTGNFSKHLHNGDPLTRRTTRVPAGRPKGGSPPFTWEESALDALRLKKLDAVDDWSDEQVCYQSERYNGFGYRLQKTGINSPYLWSGTNHYRIGKFIADHKLDRTHVDKQLGCIPIWRRVEELTQEHENVDGSDTITMAQRIKRAVEAMGVSITGLFTYDNAIIAGQTALVAGVACLAVWALMHYMEKKRRQAAREGRYTTRRG